MLTHLNGYKREAVLAPLFKMLEATFDLFVPLVMADIVNVGIAAHDFHYILMRCGILLLLAIIGNLQMYAQPVMLATSGTGLLAVPFKDNYLYLVHIYQQVFGSQRFGYGLALSWVIVVIILVFTLLVLKSSKRWVNYDL